MGSGEADAYRVSDLERFRRCSVPGCEWRVMLADRCFRHGGPRVPQYVQGLEGDIVSQRFMPK